MVTFEKALKSILGKTKRLGVEELALGSAIDCVLAEDIVADFEMPPFNKSAMDGYALHSSDSKDIPKELKCLGVVKPGAPSKKAIKKGECVKIMTGAPIPKGADSVVMVEHTGESKRPDFIRVLRSVRKWENVCFKGEDMRKGVAVLKMGTPMKGPEVAISAALGRTKVNVYRKPSVAILNTGDEIVEPGDKRTNEKIYNSNGPMLSSLLSTLNIRFVYLGIAKDEEKRLKELVVRGLDCDILLLSGGVSMGDFDLVPGILKRCQVREVFHNVSIKPGKPIFFGTRKDRLVFGIPGNPVSTYLAFLTLIKPAIEKMMGKSPRLNIRHGVLKKDFRQRRGRRRHFIPAKVTDRDRKLHVFPVKGYHGSADIASLSLANAFMIVDGKIPFLKKNSPVEILLW